MKFRIASFIYRVRISEGPLIDERGKDVASLYSWAEKSIFINGQLNPLGRLEGLFHELSHAWRQHYGQPVDEEDVANRQSNFSIDMMRQLESQGGVWALGKLQPDGIAEAQKEVPNTSYAMNCPRCSSMIASGTIQTSPPRLFNGAPAVDREVRCEFCNDMPICWTEGATVTGKPNGLILDGPHAMANA